MPQVGERRSGATETVEWDGSRWAPVSAAPSTGADGDLSSPGDTSALSVLSRFLGGALKTSPLNPMNLLSAVAHPVDTAVNTVTTPLRNAYHAAGDLSDLVTGGANNDRTLAAAQLGRHVLGAIPLVGEPLAQAGETIGRGDVAGGLGQIAGVGSSALVPEVPGAAGTVADVVGRGAERVGSALVDRPAIGRMTLPGLGIAESALRGDPKGLAVAAAPYGLKYGGRGLQRLGSALNGLQDSIDTMRGKGSSAGTAASEPVAPSSAPASPNPEPSPASAAPAPPSDPILEQIEQEVRMGRQPQSVLDLYKRRNDPSLGPIRPKGGTSSTPATSPIASKLDSAIGGLTGDTASAAADNIANGSSFSNGHIIPEARPTELTDLAEEGGARQDRPYDIDYGGVMPDFTFEAGDPNRPGLSVGSAGPKTTLDRLETATAAANPASSTPGGREMQSFTDFSDALDPIINAATPADFPPPRTGFLSRSTPTKADLAGLAKLRAGNPDYPYAEMPQDKLASILRNLQPQ